MTRLLPVAVLAALLLPAQAFAHATLEHTSPGFEQRLGSSPRKVTLDFDQYVKALPRSLTRSNKSTTIPSSGSRPTRTVLSRRPDRPCDFCQRLRAAGWRVSSRQLFTGTTRGQY